MPSGNKSAGSGIIKQNTSSGNTINIGRLPRFAIGVEPSVHRQCKWQRGLKNKYQRMKISLIAAVSENNAIGKNNQLLWHLPNDLKFFKNTTWAMPVIMGRKTFESVNNQPLNGRTNIVITRQPQQIHAPEGVFVVPDLKTAIETAAATDAKEVFIAGGGQIYEAALPMADKLILTRVHTTIDGDVFFPAFETAQWQQTYHLNFAADEKHAFAYSFQVWQRK